MARRSQTEADEETETVSLSMLAGVMDSVRRSGVLGGWVGERHVDVSMPWSLKCQAGTLQWDNNSQACEAVLEIVPV